MCGIIGLVCLPGKTREKPSVMTYKGLLRLEYRGYDSAGMASVCSGRIFVVKAKGKIAEIEEKLGFTRLDGYTFIAHTRWATHGKPSDENAHPHLDCSGRIAVVHNGIIQNYRELKRMLIERGHVFTSETDTEVIPHLIEENYKRTNDLYKAFKETIKQLEGSYAIAMISSIEPDKIFFARKDSPLVIGVGDGYNLVASDIPAFLEYTRRAIVVHDYEVGYITPTTIVLEKLSGEQVDWRKRIRFIEWSIEDATKAGYPHFMIKEIHEQPRALKDTLYGLVRESSVEEAVKLIIDADKVYVTAAGTSYHAGLYYSLLSSIIACKPVIPFIASEYRVYENTSGARDVLVVISQSGETIDSLMALRALKKNDTRVIAVSNVIDSAIPRESDVAVYTRAGPEIGVAATKTFTTQTLVLAWLTIRVGEETGVLDKNEADELRKWLVDSPRIVSRIIADTEDSARKLAEWMAGKGNAYYLSRGIGVPVAMEGALKLKEIAYIHAEAYPAGESKHGPIALVEPGYPVVFTIPADEYLEKLLLGNIQEMKARGGFTIGFVPEDSSLIEQLDYVFRLPRTHWILTPLTHTPPMQLLAYYTAVKRGYDPDKPRNLAKTVTVE